MHKTTLGLLLGIWSHLSRRRKYQLLLLIPSMLASGGAELLSLGAVFPFLLMLSDPDRLWQYPFVSNFSLLVGFTESEQLLLPVTLAFAFSAVFASSVRLSNVWLNGRIAAAVGSDLSCESYYRILYQPYKSHVQRHSSTVITGVTTHVTNTVGALNALLQIVTSSVVALGIFLGLVLIDASVALTATLVFGVTYALLSFRVRGELRSNGQKITYALNKQVKTLQEGLGAIRDVLLDGTQASYLYEYSLSDRPQRQLRAKNSFIGAFPRFVLEGLGIVLIALLGGLLVSQRGSGVTVIPLLGALALGSQRMLPALQQIYSSWAALRGCNDSMSWVLTMVNQPIPNSICKLPPLPFNHSLRFQDVSFCYAQNGKYVLRDINLSITPGQRIGFIGTTGSGKSTLIDILMGLLEPSTGFLFVDAQNINEGANTNFITSWRANIAHVPQHIYLADSSIAQNIAFGIPFDQIDMRRVKKAAKQAQILDFIEESSDGFNTFVGESGMRLSGGQRQRIGIARALYKKAKVLVFDEATSALDTTTEDAVMNAISCLHDDITTILIAHRLSTIRNCDRVIRLEGGLIISDGPPQTILP